MSASPRTGAGFGRSDGANSCPMAVGAPGPAPRRCAAVPMQRCIGTLCEWGHATAAANDRRPVQDVQSFAHRNAGRFISQIYALLPIRKFFGRLFAVDLTPELIRRLSSQPKCVGRNGAEGAGRAGRGAQLGSAGAQDPGIERASHPFARNRLQSRGVAQRGAGSGVLRVRHGRQCWPTPADTHDTLCGARVGHSGTTRRHSRVDLGSRGS